MGIFDCDCACADYSGVAAASSEANKVSEKLGQDQLAEARRQYDNNMAVTKPVVDSQLALMKQTKDQGDDYYNYMKSKQRPVEDALNYEAMGLTPEEVAQVQAARQQEGAGNTAAMDAARAEYQKYVQKVAQSSSPAGMGGAKFDVNKAFVDVPVPAPTYEGGGFSGIRRILGPAAGQVPTNQKEIDAAFAQNKLNASLREAFAGKLGDATPGQSNVSLPTFDSLYGSFTPDRSSSDALLQKFAAAASARKQATDKTERDAITNAGLIRQEDVDAHMAKIQGMRDKLAMGRDDAYQADKSNIDAGINRAVADVNQQGSAAIGQNNRALAAYGINPNSGRFVSADRNAAMQQAAMGAGAANTAREAGIADFKNRTAGSLAGENEDFTQKSAIGLQRASTLSNTRNMRLQDDATGWAKKLDVAGLYRNLPGASQGAYGLSTSAGNSAVGNNASAGNALMSGLSSGTNTIMSGKQTQINGLLGAANGEQAGFNAQAQSGTSGLGSVMGLAKLGMQAYTTFSDRRIKENIKLVGTDERTGLNIYEFNYTNPDDRKRYRGVMADEVEKVMPEAVAYDENGIASVNYGAIGIDFVEA